MPGVTSSRHLTPRTTRSGLVVALTAADSATTIQVPVGASAVSLAFYDPLGNLVRGRVGFSVEGTTPTLTDGDDTLGYQGRETVTYYLSSWCVFLHVAAPDASPTTTITVRGTWWYD